MTTLRHSRHLIVLILLYIGTSDGLLSSINGVRRSTRLNAKQIVIFGPNNLRVHDNPCLTCNEGKPIIPIIYSPLGDVKQQKAVDSLVKNLKKIGGNALVIDSTNIDATDGFTRFLQQIQEKDEEVSITYCKSAVEPAASSVNRLITSAGALNAQIKCNGVWDEIISLNPAEVNIPNLHFDEFTEQYKEYSLEVPKPVMQPNVIFDQILTQTVTPEYFNLDTSPSISGGEERGLQLLTEYLNIGDKAFSYKYASTYAAEFSSSKSHTESLTRLSYLTTKENKISDQVGTNFFQGEIISALLAPLLTMGCLSPRLLIHAKNTLTGKGNSFVNKEFPFRNRVREEAVRRDWHQQLARASKTEQESDSIYYTKKIEKPVPVAGTWDLKYHNWRGYIQREGEMISTNIANESPSNGVKKPLAFLLHGTTSFVLMI